MFLKHHSYHSSLPDRNRNWICWDKISVAYIGSKLKHLAHGSRQRNRLKVLGFFWFGFVLFFSSPKILFSFKVFESNIFLKMVFIVDCKINYLYLRSFTKAISQE